MLSNRELFERVDSAINLLNTGHISMDVYRSTVLSMIVHNHDYRAANAMNVDTREPVESDYDFDHFED